MLRENKEVQEASFPQKEDFQAQKIVDSHCNSQFKSLYLQSMKPFLDMISDNHLQGIRKQMNRRQYCWGESEAISENIQISTKSSSINKEVVMLNLKWGCYEMDINILNIMGESMNHLGNCQKGVFSNVYFGYFAGKKIALKCIPIKQKQSRSKAIKEWFILKVGSTLEFGPKIEQCFGFDILMFENCIEFAMQPCQKLSSAKFNFDMLFWNLSLMHKLHIVHQDIKPENMMLSPFHKKPVFIDFGLSRVIKEQIGEKSLSKFVGTVNFCSSEMGLLLMRQEEKMVDLYYNDFQCLKTSIKSLKQSQPQVQLQNKQIFPLNYFYHANLYFLKWQLYTSDIQCFEGYWSSLMESEDTSRLSAFRTAIIIFLQELVPSEKTKNFFWKFTDISEIEMPYYIRIKIMFEVSQSYIYFKSIFQIEEKLKVFQGYCNDYLIGNETREHNRLNNIQLLMLSQETIKKSPKKNYFYLYLEYMSYVNNVFQVNALKREQAARIFCDIYISDKVISQKKGRALVEQTIKHILEWLLESSELKDDCFTFALLAFRLYDFLTILDMGSSEQFLRWLDRIFFHEGFSEIVKKIFLIRVQLSLWFMRSRPLKKKGVDRIWFISLVENWVDQKSKELWPASAKLVLLQDERKLMRQGCSEQFYREIQQQLCYYQLVRQERLKFNGPTETFKILQFIYCSRNYFPFFYCIIDLYWNLFTLNDSSFSRRLYSIIQKNIADDQILQELSVSFELEVFSLVTIQQQAFSIDKFYQINNYFMSISNRDLILFKKVFIRIITKLKRFLDILGQATVDFCSSKTNFIYRAVEVLLSYYEKKLFKEENRHYCLGWGQFQFLHSFSTFLMPSRQKQVQRFYDAQIISQVNCQQCRSVLRGNELNMRLFNGLTRFCLGYYNRCLSEQELKIPSFLFQEISKKSSQVKNNPEKNIQQFNIFLRSLTLGQLLCCIDDTLEKQYHGIQIYCQFVMKNNMLELYFQDLSRFCFPFNKTLEVLQKSNPSMLVMLLSKLALHLESKLLRKQFCIIVTGCYSIFGKYSEPELAELFTRLKNYQRVFSSEKSPSIAIIYLVMFSLPVSINFYRTLAKEMFKTVHQLHSMVQRQILMRIYFKVYQRLKKSGDQSIRCKRQKMFCKNRLVKQLMIESYSNDVSSRPITKKGKKGLLLQKMSKIQEYNEQGWHLRFSRRF